VERRIRRAENDYEEHRAAWGELVDDRDGVRIMHALMAAGFVTIEGARRARMEELLAVRGIGAKSVERIKRMTTPDEVIQPMGKVVRLAGRQTVRHPHHARGRTGCQSRRVQGWHHRRAVPATRVAA
jgi:hypothetical protein